MDLMSQYCRTLLFHFIFSFHSSSLPDAFFFLLVFFQTTSSFILLLFTPFSFFFLFIICPFPLPSICLLILLNLILRLLYLLPFKAPIITWLGNNPQCSAELMSRT